ncbi:MAG: site-specific integrase, partial [Gemmatimonadota bacterium]
MSRAAPPRDEARSDFARWIEGERRLSPHTIAAYRRDLEKFAAFCQRHRVKLPRVDRSLVVDFLGSLYQQGLDSRSVARALVALRTFFRFLRQDKCIR